MSQPRRIKRPVDGVLLLDKPLGLSSNTALQQARFLFSAAKAGHTGVLDPLATGLLPVCFGEATKFSSFLLDADKAYRATVCLGVTTSTGDAEGKVLSQRPVNVSLEVLQRLLPDFLGQVTQVPPMYSALKHQGRALYEYAREGIEIERAARQITIHSMALIAFDGREAVIDVRCSKGTYIRTLSEDIGQRLGCGAHLTGLRRTATAGFSLDSAVSLDQLTESSQSERDALLLPADILVGHLPEIVLTEHHALRFCHGQSVRIDENHAIMPRYRVYRQLTRDFLGLAELRENSQLQPVRLMAVQAAS